MVVSKTRGFLNQFRCSETLLVSALLITVGTPLGILAAGTVNEGDGRKETYDGGTLTYHDPRLWGHPSVNYSHPTPFGDTQLFSIKLEGDTDLRILSLNERMFPVPKGFVDANCRITGIDEGQTV